MPEGALAYPVLDLRNPFPIDWFWDHNYRGGDHRGNYLVRFQTGVFGLGLGKPGQAVPFFSDQELSGEFESRLVHATRSNCDCFVAFYDPVRA